MHWNRLRPGGADDIKQERRHSILDPASHVEAEDGVTPSATGDRPQRLLKVPASQDSRRSLRAASAEDLVTPSLHSTGPATDTPHSNRRFSFLAKRQISDPQLFKTAKQQAVANVPPIPKGMKLF